MQVRLVNSHFKVDIIFLTTKVDVIKPAAAAAAAAYV
jgi:hypothetical protein